MEHGENFAYGILDEGAKTNIRNQFKILMKYAPFNVVGKIRSIEVNELKFSGILDANLPPCIVHPHLPIITRKCKTKEN